MKRILLFLAVIISGVVYGQVPANFQVNSNAAWFKDDGGTGTFKPGGWVIVDNGIILNGDTMTSVPTGGGVFHSRTYAQISNIISGDSLKLGHTYFISDKGVYSRAVSGSALDLSNSACEIRVPNIYANGFWSAGGTYIAGDRVVWGGKIWSNVSGNVGASVDDFSLDAEWAFVAESDPDYVDFYLGCTYDFTNDWVSMAWDNRGNVAGCSYEFAQISGFTANPVNHCDWGDIITLISNNNVLYFCNNIAQVIAGNNLGFYFISGNTAGNAIADNSNKGNISNNSNTGNISNNSNTGNILSNSNGGVIENNSNGGVIENNSNGGDISNNSNAGYISDNSNAGGVENNANAGYISSNTSQVLDISGNFNAGYISSNDNTGNIENNGNLGWISGNSNTGNITTNSNNGYIQNLTSVVLNVYNNTNNGNISTSTAGDIFDTVVDK